MVKKKILGLFFLTLFVLTSAVSSFAASTSSSSIELPVYTLPDLNELEMPTLSKNYDAMAQEMKEMGWGTYKWEEYGEVPLPSVEKPTNFGTTAAVVFNELYGDLWNSSSTQLRQESLASEKQAIVNAAQAFASSAKEEMKDIKEEDKKRLSQMFSSVTLTSGVAANSTSDVFSKVNSILSGISSQKGSLSIDREAIQSTIDGAKSEVDQLSGLNTPLGKVTQGLNSLFTVDYGDLDSTTQKAGEELARAKLLENRRGHR